MPFKATAENPGQLAHIHLSLLHTETLGTRTHCTRLSVSAQVGQLSTGPVAQESPTNRDKLAVKVIGWRWVLCPVDQSVSESQVPWEECALPWQHKAGAPGTSYGAGMWGDYQWWSEIRLCVCLLPQRRWGHLLGVSLDPIESHPHRPGPVAFLQHFLPFGSVPRTSKQRHCDAASPHFGPFRLCRHGLISGDLFYVTYISAQVIMRQ